jgi:hypothetical protein
MNKAGALLIFVMCVASISAGTPTQDPATLAKRTILSTALDQTAAIKVTIATVDPLLYPPTNRYRVGEQLPVVISMTNTSSEQTYVSVSSDLYQDRPKLTKNGQVVPYTKWQAALLRNTSQDQTCIHEDMPETVLLRANQPTVIDFLFVVDDKEPTGVIAWYDPLTPGVYELSIQRRLGLCDGPTLESNTVSFEVIP